MRLGGPIGIDRLVPEKEDPGRPGAGEVLVRVRASSLNFHDYLVVTGQIPSVVAGLVPLSDGAGEVVEVGPPPVDRRIDPTLNWEIGDKVLGTFFPRWHDGSPEPWKTSVVTGEQVDGYAREFAVVPAAALTLLGEKTAGSRAETPRPRRRIARLARVASGRAPDANARQYAAS